MSLSPLWRTRLVAVGAAVVAMCVGVAVANGNYFWPLVLAAAVALFAVAQWQSRPLTTLLLCGLVFGYIVGNRGFAQLMPFPGVPLLPAEAVLLISGTLLLVQSAWRHELPIRRDVLNLLLLVWLAAGIVRVIFDFSEFRFVAIRDFATVYYTLFFFLAQDAARTIGARRAVMNTVLIGCVVLFGTHLVYERYPGFFFNTLTIGGSPLIAYKGDLVGTFLAVGSLLFFLWFEQRQRWWLVAASLGFAAAVIAAGNRAPMLGLAVVAAWLALGRRWRFAALLGGSGLAAALIILAVAATTNTSWEKTPLFGAYERVVSLVDPLGQRSYRSANTAMKGDNNLFRAVWWRAVATETVQENPYLGLGFGRDLADRFLREYYPEGSDEFTARSPHNILLTIFARMGALGLGLFVAAMAVVAVRTWRAIRAGPDAAAPWCAAWVILISACFGVVLEGPMGAVVFWTLLGLAHGTAAEAGKEQREEGSAQPEEIATPATL
ncbi:O-antigen ligase family protein [Opitutus terrae]|uniref:O-antigen polymerase n=1 Tax=Opitutus terrae (strain DSM 11246 / JCM 15787 / PB90-1) TaxID=452637 RepID=B1ZQA1_OPITP|nr:O-antigen ligase family protein [Opitutus terrae]ACB73581.1 O-antigen polymerase [Opitutus terrae PB90-1]